MHAEKSLYKFSRSEIKYFRNMDRIKGEMEREDMKRYAYKTGHAEGHAAGHAAGHAEGHAEGRDAEKLEIAKNALAEGIPPETIQKITGLDIQDIMSLT